MQEPNKNTILILGAAFEFYRKHFPSMPKEVAWDISKSVTPNILAQLNGAELLDCYVDENGLFQMQLIHPISQNIITGSLDV